MTDPTSDLVGWADSQKKKPREDVVGHADLGRGVKSIAIGDYDKIQDN